MKYKIGELSKILNLSAQMIRYYEKCGVILSEREGKGKYRYYTEKDIFLFFEAMRYKGWNVKIKDIPKIIEGDLFEDLFPALRAFRDQLQDEINYKSRLLARMEQIEKDLSYCWHNVGSFWVEKVPAQRRISIGLTGMGETFRPADQMGLPSSVGDSDQLTFFDLLVEFPSEDVGAGQETWWHQIQERHCAMLQLNGCGKMVPEQHCACTVADAGESFELVNAGVQTLRTQARERGLVQNGPAYGVLLGRGKENGRVHKRLKLYLPIETLSPL